MDLRRYLNKNKIQIKEFAKMVGVTRKTVHNWLDGTSAPLHTHRILIFKLTHGGISCEEWDYHEGKPRLDMRKNGCGIDGMQNPQRLDANKKAKPKSKKDKG